MTTDSDIAVLKRDTEVISKTVEKVQDNLTKISDVATNIAKILAVHDSRLTTSEKLHEELFLLAEKRRIETQEKIAEVYDRLEAMQDNQSESEQRILNAIKAGNMDAAKTFNEYKKSTDSRIDSLEKWRWMLMGGGMVIGFVLGKIPLVAEFIKQSLS